MEKFTTLRGVAAPLPMVNVDTDMIIPKNFLKTIKRTGLKEGLFYEMRWTADGQKKDFVLDQPAYQNAKIIVAGPNFGCGSSREHAPWALLDFGIRCVISEDFADIFYNNCFKNGILPIKMPKEIIDKLMDDASRGSNAIIEVDLEKQEIKGPDGGTVHFDIDPFRKHCLLKASTISASPWRRSRRSTTSRRSRRKRSPGCTPRPEHDRRSARPETRSKTMASNRNLLVLPGDGIGPEVMNEVRKIIAWMGKKRAVGFDIKEDLVGGAALDKHGVPLTDDTMKIGARGRRGAVRLGRRPEVGHRRLQQEARARPAAPAQGDGPLRQPAPGQGVRRAGRRLARSSPRSSRVSTS